MYIGHPYDCRKRAYPTVCLLCSADVIYWECYHGSKVFFEPPNFGQHDCVMQSPNVSRVGPSSPRLSGREANRALEGVSESVRPDDFDLLPGMRRVSSSLASELASLWTKRSEATQRVTVSIPPPMGETRESVFGEIADIVEIDLRTRFGISDSSVLARMLSGRFHDLRATQITILVDDILNDPDVVDVMSYTVWCPGGVAPNDLAKRQTVDAVIAPVELLGIGRKWVMESIDRL